MKDTINLLIVDDSKFIRRAICKVFEASDNVQVVGEAENGEKALVMIPRLDPDVVSLDINMPVMDGLTALKHIMVESPRPTVMFSTLTQEGADVTFDALRYGAIDFILKPSKLKDNSLEEQQQQIIRKVTLAAGVEVDSIQYLRARAIEGETPGIIFCEECGEKNIITPEQIQGNTIQCRKCNDMIALPGSDAAQASEKDCNHVFAIGAAEGGYGALLKIIPRLNPGLPTAFLVMLYEALPHVDAFARYLDTYSPLKVKRAVDSEPIRDGVCYLASGEEYVTINSSNGTRTLMVSASPFPTRRGSINMLMLSVGEAMKEHAVGAVLSGSGDDGAEGLGEILRLGGAAIVQDPKTCLCKEMARSAMDKCKADLIVSDKKMGTEINNFIFR